MLCYVMLCYVMICYVMICYVMVCHAMLCHTRHTHTPYVRMPKLEKLIYDSSKSFLPFDFYVPALTPVLMSLPFVP